MSGPAYIELAVLSNFSFLRGASKPEELVVTAALLGYAGVGLADRNTVAGVVRAWSQSKHVKFEGDGAAPINPPYHPGARLVFCDGTPDVLAYPRDRKGWGNLCRLLTEANLRDESPKGDPQLYRSDLLEFGDCMSLAVLPDLEADTDETLVLLRRPCRPFRQGTSASPSPRLSGNDRFRLEQAAILAAAAGMKLMAVNDVLYHSPRTAPAAGRAHRDPPQRAGCRGRLRTQGERRAAHEDAGRDGAAVPEPPGGARRDDPFRRRAEVLLHELRHNYPEETTEEGVDPQTELERLAWEGAAGRYPKGIPEKVSNLLRHELEIVARQEIRALLPHRA